MESEKSARQLLNDIANDSSKKLLVLDNQFVIAGPGGMGTHIVYFLERDFGIPNEAFTQFEHQGLITRQEQVFLPELNDTPATLCTIDPT